MVERMPSFLQVPTCQRRPFRKDPEDPVTPGIALSRCRWKRWKSLSFLGTLIGFMEIYRKRDEQKSICGVKTSMVSYTLSFKSIKLDSGVFYWGILKQLRFSIWIFQTAQPHCFLLNLRIKNRAFELSLGCFD